MKIASVLMTIVFAGVVAQANEAAPAADHETAAAQTETATAPAHGKMDKKAAKKHTKEDAPAATTAPATETATPAGH